MSSSYKAGFLTSVTGYTTAIDGLTYWPNGMVQEVKRRNADGTDGPVDRYEIDAANGMARPLSITFTAPSLQGVAAKAVHLVEIRNALNAARQGLGLPAWAYTTPPPAAGQVCAAAHVNDLRGGAR